MKDQDRNAVKAAIFLGLDRKMCDNLGSWEAMLSFLKHKHSDVDLDSVMPTAPQSERSAALSESYFFLADSKSLFAIPAAMTEKKPSFTTNACIEFNLLTGRCAFKQISDPD